MSCNVLRKRVLQKEETLDRKSETFEKREQSLSDRDNALKKEKERVEVIKQQHLSELEKNFRSHPRSSERIPIEICRRRCKT